VNQEGRQQHVHGPAGRKTHSQKDEETDMTPKFHPEYQKRPGEIKSFLFPVYAAHEFPDSDDPKITTLMMRIRTLDWPAGIPNNPNARNPTPEKRLYKEVAKSLRSNDGCFYLRNRGIRIFAEAVERVGPKTYSVAIDMGAGGIADGGNTARIIENANAEDNPPNRQYVSVIVEVGLPPEDRFRIVVSLKSVVSLKRNGHKPDRYRDR
jgi:hypothetical protein